MWSLHRTGDDRPMDAVPGAEDKTLFEFKVGLPHRSRSWVLFHDIGGCCGACLRPCRVLGACRHGREGSIYEPLLVLCFFNVLLPFVGQLHTHVMVGRCGEEKVRTGG